MTTTDQYPAARLPTAADPTPADPTPADPTPADPTPADGTRRRLRVLCVDDNPDAADSLRRLAEIYGYEAAACTDGPSAIALAEQFQPDVCVLDLNMPGMDGIALARWLVHQAENRPMGMLAVTAMTGDEYTRQTTAAGFRRHLVKPVDPDELLGELAAVWEEARQAYLLATTPVRHDRPG